MTILEPEEFQRWKDQPLTREFLKVLAKRRQALMEGWGSGQMLTPEQQSQAVLLGQLAAVSFDDVCDMAGVERAETVE